MGDVRCPMSTLGVDVKTHMQELAFLLAAHCNERVNCNSINMNVIVIFTQNKK